MSSSRRNQVTRPITDGDRFGHLIHLKPEYRERYIVLHAHPFPGLIERMQEAGLRNYSIFLRDHVLFSYYEYVGDNFEEDMDAMAEDETVQDWWTLTDPMQEPLSERKEGAWWTAMEELFHGGQKSVSTKEGNRKAFVSAFRDGASSEGRNLFTTLGEAFESELEAADIQNYTVYGRKDRLYTYLEYSGDDFSDTLRQLKDGPVVSRLRHALDPLLEPMSPSADDPKRPPMESVFYMA